MRMHVVHGSMRTGVNEHITRSLAPPVAQYDEAAGREAPDEAVRLDGPQAVVRIETVRPQQPQNFRTCRPCSPLPRAFPAKCGSNLQGIAKVACLTRMQRE